MKYILLFILFTSSFQVFARCNGHAAANIISEVFSIKEIKEDDIPNDAYDSITDVCMSGCYAKSTPECSARYAAAVKKHLPEFEKKLNKKADVKLIDKYLNSSNEAGSIPGCKYIGDYKRTVVNPCKLSNCGSIRQAVLCEVRVFCKPGSIKEQSDNPLGEEMDLTCVGNVEGNCPSMQACNDDEEYKKYEGADKIKELDSQVPGASRQ